MRSAVADFLNWDGEGDPAGKWIRTTSKPETKDSYRRRKRDELQD